MKTIYLFLTLSLFQQNIYSQNFWEEISVVPGYGITGLYFDKNDNIIIRSPFAGFYRSTDNGISWNGFFGERYPSDLKINSNNVYFVCGEGGAFRSIDNGVSWSELTGLLNYYVYFFTITLNDNVFAGTSQGKVLYSSNNGDSWGEVSLPNNLFVTSIDVNSSNHLFAATKTSGVLFSSDNGNSWTEVNNGLSNLNITALEINSSDEIFVTADYENFFISTNNGESWMNISSNLNNRGIWCLAVNNNNQIFIAPYHGHGVFRSNDNGENWDDVSSGLDTTRVADALNFNSTGFVFAGNSGLGSELYRSVNSTTAANEENQFPSIFLLEQNYPNPFNPSTKISWQALIGGWQKLKVYDVLGNEVATLVNEYRPAGSYEVEFKSTVGSHQLANGVYFYQLKAGDYVETKKMILLK